MKGSNKIIAFILAAGCSKRFPGAIKQLLPFRGKTITQHVIDVARNSKAERVYVVLGCRWRTIRRRLSLGRAGVIVNRYYSRGMSSSVKVAIKRAIKEKADAALIILADQPLVSSDLLNRLVDEFLSRDGVEGAVSSFNDVISTPAIIGKSLFDDVMKLEGDAGAKSVLLKSNKIIKVRASPNSLMDIDTKEDYERLLNLS